ncbi:MAG: Flp pilus assembly complex ATPase component TadA [Bacilli bacterium]|nr:Flp pilus assembly complex ATPase component TadA [Bacilli bacterium]
MEESNENVFSQLDFGPLQEYLDNDDVTDVSYSQSQIHLKTLSQGNYRVENPNINNAFMEKLAFQCSNAMGKTFNMAHPMLDSESAELRMNFIHDSISKNGIACVIRKTPAKIRLEKQKLLNEDYITEDIHDFLITCVQGHCNILVCGETGSGKTEFVKYLASKTNENEKIITIEDTLELHLDRIFPHRDIVTLKTNNIASYSDVLVACMRQNPIWILLSEVRSAEAVTAVRNSISSGHFILSTIHADKSASIPMRLYSLMETSQDVTQFLTTVYRYIQLGVCIRGRQDKVTKKFKREIADISEFYVDENNVPKSHLIYRKTSDGRMIRSNPTKYLIDYLDAQGITLPPIQETNTIDDEAPELPNGAKFEKAQVSGEEKPAEEKKPEAVTAEKPVVPTPTPVQKPVTPVAPQTSTVAQTTSATPVTPTVTPVSTPSTPTTSTPSVGTTPTPNPTPVAPVTPATPGVVNQTNNG